MEREKTEDEAADGSENANGARNAFKNTEKVEAEHRKMGCKTLRKRILLRMVLKVIVHRIISPNTQGRFVSKNIKSCFMKVNASKIRLIQ